MLNVFWEKTPFISHYVRDHILPKNNNISYSGLIFRYVITIIVYKCIRQSGNISLCLLSAVLVQRCTLSLYSHVWEGEILNQVLYPLKSCSVTHRGLLTSR